jgi:hypothetical protein
VDLEVVLDEGFGEVLKVRLVEWLTARKADVNEFIGLRPVYESGQRERSATFPRIHPVEVRVAVMTDFLPDAASRKADEAHESPCVHAFALRTDEAFSDLE